MQNSQFDLNSINRAVDALVEQGWYVWPNAIPKDLCLALLYEVEQLEQQGKLQQASIGRGESYQLNQQIRRDSIHWLERSSLAQGQFLQLMSQLKTELNRQLFLGLFEYEAHFALYPPGAFYKKHWDSFRGAADRMITTVSYLNPDWQADWGGELVMFSEDSKEIIGSVTPKIGTLVLFMSEQVPHEVKPTLQPRASIAGWFRRNTTICGKLNPAQ